MNLQKLNHKSPQLIYLFYCLTFGIYLLNPASGVAQVWTDSLSEERGHALKNNDVELVIALDKEIVQENINKGDTLNEILSLVQLARDHYRLNKDKENGNLILREAIHKLQANHSLPDSQKGFGLKNIGDAFMALGDWDSMRHYLSLAEHTFLKAEAWDAAISTLLGRGFAAYSQRDYTLAIEELENTISSAHTYLSDTNNILGVAHNVIGVCYSRLGDYDLAMSHAKQGIEFEERRNARDKVALSKSLNTLGYFYRLKGDFNQAFEYYQQSLRTLEQASKHSPKDIKARLNNISIVLYRKKDFDMAVFYGKRQLALIQEHPLDFSDKDFIAATNNIAVPLIELGAFDSAKAYLFKALTRNPQDLQSLQNLSFAHRKAGNHYDSQKLLEQILPIYLEKRGPHHNQTAKVYRHLGIVHINQQNYPEALTNFQQCLISLSADFQSEAFQDNPPLETINNQLTFLRCLRDKAKALQLLYTSNPEDPKVLQAALNTSLLAIELIGIMRKEYTEGSKQFLMSEYFPVFERGIEICFLLNQTTGNKSYLAEAYDISEQCKATLLLEGLRESKAKEAMGIPVALAKEEKKLKIDRAFYRKLIFNEKRKGEKADSAKLNLWGEKVYAINRKYEALSVSIEQEYPEYFHMKYREVTPTISAIQQSLEQTESRLLAYFQGDRHLYTFSLNPSGLQAHQTPWNDSLQEALSSYLSFMSDRDFVLESGQREMLELAQQAWFWYNLLVEPVISKGDTQALVIVPDGLLSYLPFESLVTKAPIQVSHYHDLSYLLEICPIRYSFSATLFVEEKEPSEPSWLGNVFTGFAPSYGRGVKAPTHRGITLAPLASNQPEVRDIQNLMGGKSLLAEEASEQNFRKWSTKSQILHLAMHALTNDEDPMYSGLVFSEEAYYQGLGTRKKESSDSLSVTDEMNDGYLYAYELYNLKLDAHLAVLSACNTGGGKLLRGEGVMSLSRAFRYAGCPNLLISLWQVDDQATYDLMLSYYQKLKEGYGKDEALRQAKINYLKTHDQTHPHYWAAFVLIGNQQSIPGSNKEGLYLSLLALIVLVALLWWGRKRWKKMHLSS